MRYDWVRSLIKNTGRSDDDFTRESDAMFSLNLFENESPRIIQKNKEQIYQNEVSNQSAKKETNHLMVKSLTT